MKSFWDVYWYVAKPNSMDRDYVTRRVTHDDFERAAMGRAIMSFNGAAVAAKSTQDLRAQWVGGMDNVYRVFIDKDGRKIEVVCLGMGKVDSEVEGIYNQTDELPVWMQEKLALLSMIKVNPPQTKIEGLGMRVDDNVFWVIKGD